MSPACPCLCRPATSHGPHTRAENRGSRLRCATSRERRTVCWRKQDSNFRFLVGPETQYGLTRLGAIRPHGSTERYAGDAAALGQQVLLDPEVGRYRVRSTRALVIEIPAARLRQLVVARGKPGLGYASLM